jgi:hypothetical protein
MYESETSQILNALFAPQPKEPEAGLTYLLALKNSFEEACSRAAIDADSRADLRCRPEPGDGVSE